MADDRTLQANFSANTAGFTQGTSVLRQKLTELNTNMEQTKQAVKQANTEMKDYQKELTQLRRETDNGNKATSEQSSRMQELRERIARTVSELGTLRTAEQDIRSQIRNVNQEIQNQQSVLGTVTSSAATMGEVLKANLASSGIQTAIGKLTSSLRTAAEYCYNVGTSFEAGMSGVKAISGATEEEFQKLSDRAKELGASTKFTATEVSQAMNYMAMAGWDAEQMLDGIGGVISLAAASGGDLATTSDIVTDAITAFELKAEDVAHFSDVLAAASANANTNVSMMGETFQYCAPIAGALGFSIEDVSEAIGLMANSGVKSSMAGTALRTLFTKLSDDIKITGQNLGEVTIQTSNADGSMRSLNEILTDMRAAFSQLSESERSSAAESIAGKYAMTGLLTLMNAGAGDVDKLRTAIEECDGSAADMAETMQNNTAGAVTIMQSALEGLGLAVYDKFGDQLRDKINQFTDSFSDLTNRIDAGEFDDTFERIANAVGGAADQLAELAKTALPGFVEGIANTISFLVEYRSVIVGIVATMTSFKLAMAVSTVVTNLARSIRAVAAAASVTKNAIQALTIAQQANNIAAAANPYLALASALLALGAGIAALIISSNNAAESVGDLSEKAAELNQTAQQSDQAAQEVHGLVEEYKNIKEASDDTEEAKQRLKEIQDTLIDTYDVEADKIDLVNGKYEEQLGILTQVADKKDETARIATNSAYYAAVSAQKQAFAIEGYQDAAKEAHSGNEVMYNQLTSDIASTAKAYGTEFDVFRGTFAAGTSYDTIRTILQEVLTKNQGDIEEYTFGDYAKSDEGTGLEALVNVITNAMTSADSADSDLKLLTELYEYYNSPDKGDDEPFAPGAWRGKEYTDEYNRRKSESEHSGGVDWTDYKSVKKYYQYMMDTNQIDETQFYDYLEEYANKLLDPNSDEWRTATAEIYKGRNKSSGSSGKDPNEEAYDSEQKYLKWRLDMGYITEEEYYEQLAALRDKYLDESSDKWRQATLAIHNFEEKSNKKKLDNLKDQYDDAIAAIDDEIKQHNRDREDEDTDKKIAEIDKQLQYDRLDDYSRQQLEQKKQELLDEKEETEWQRNHEDLKDELSTVYTMAKDAYEQSTADLDSALATASAIFTAIGNGAQQTATAVSTVNNNNVSVMMNAVSQTADQIAAAVIKQLSSSI